MLTPQDVFIHLHTAWKIIFYFNKVIWSRNSCFFGIDRLCSGGTSLGAPAEEGFLDRGRTGSVDDLEEFAMADMQRGRHGWHRKQRGRLQRARTGSLPFYCSKASPPRRPPSLRPYLKISGTLGTTVKPSGIHESGIPDPTIWPCPSHSLLDP